MKKAKRMVWQGTSVYRAGKVLGISKDTLKQHLEGQAPNSRPGPSTVLSKKDKAKLVSVDKFVDNSCRSASPTLLRETATRLLSERFNIHVNECDKELQSWKDTYLYYGTFYSMLWYILVHSEI